MSTFNPPADIAQITLAKSSDVNAVKAATGIAFGLLPDEIKLQQNKVTYEVDTGAANTYQISLPNITSYDDGLAISFKPLNSNTTQATIQINSLGAKSIRLVNDAAVQAGDIIAGAPIDLRYSSTRGYFYVSSNSANYATIATAQAVIATTQAGIATTQATNAASSASASASSASSASTSASNASTSATNASTSATTATTQAGIATTQAGLATTNGAAQVALATTQAGLATTNGAAQVALATTQANNAATSASTATTQAGIATTQAGIATTQAGLATTNGAAQVALATTQAGIATTQAANAATSATSAAASYDSFDDRYLGSKASDPTLDNDGNALLTGALYWNSTSNEMRVYSGSAWITSYLPATGYLALSGGTMTGSITFAGAQTWPTFNQSTTGNAATATTASTATNLSGGSSGTIPYQSASGTTQMLSAGTSGQLLTSAGAGVAPTWTTPAAGGGTVTMTSSGAITAGLGVIVNENGTGSIPVLTTEITAKTQSTVTANIAANSRSTLIYCASVGVYIAFYTRVTDEYLCAKIGTVTGSGVFSWGSENVLNSAVSRRITAIWVESESKFYLSYDNATNGRVMCGTVTATTITVGAQLSMFANASTQTTIAFDLTAGILVYGSGTTGSGFFNFSTINTSGVTLTANAQVASTFNSNGYKLFYWPLAQKVVLFDSFSSQLCAALITITGVAPTIGTNQVISASDVSPASAAFSSTTSNLFLLVNNFSPSAVNAVMISISGATITANTFYSVTGSNPSSQSSVTYASGVNAFVISFGSTSPYKLQSAIASVAETVITIGSATTLISSTNNAYAYGNVYDTKYGFTSNFTQVTSGDTFYVIAQTNGNGTLTSNNFLGIAKTSVSTGMSFDVSVSGSTNTAVSGLTAATLYYLNGSGQLITSPDVPVGITNTTPVKVGLALSTTSLVLK